MLGPNPSHSLLAADLRMGWLGLLVLLAAFFWSWAQAHAAPVSLDISDNEMVHWTLADAQEADIEPSESALNPARDLICRKPAPYKPGADQVPKEIADQDLLSCLDPWIALPQGAPAPGPQPALPQTERQPLLRPPAHLG